MASLIDVYTRVRDAVSELAELEYRVDTLEEDLRKAYSREKAVRDKTFGSGTFGSIVAFSCAVIGFLCGSLIGAIIAFFAYAILCLVVDSLFFEKKRNREADRIHMTVVEPKEQKISDIKEKINVFYSSKVINFYFSHFPPECQSLDALDFLIDSLLYGKADTEKELFALWENELYKRQMLQMQEEQIRQIKQVARNQQQQSEIMMNQSRLLEKQAVQQKKLSRQVRYGNVVSTLDFLTKD